MPSTTSSSVSAVLASSTVITPSLPTFCMAWAIISPMSLSPLAEMVPTWAISSDEATFLARDWMSFTASAVAMSMPRLRSIGFMPAATALAPSRTMDWARTVAVVVPSPAVSLVFEATSRTIWAPMFSNLSESSISLATVTPSLVMRGAPNDFSITTLRPLGPRVTFTASARISTPRSILSRASVEKRTSFAAMWLLPFSNPSSSDVRGAGVSKEGWIALDHPDGMPALGRLLRMRLLAGGSGRLPGRGGGAFDDAHDVGFLHDQEILAVDADFGSGPLAEQHAVTGLHVERLHLAVLVAGAGPGGDDLALLGLLLGGVRDDDATLRLLFRIDAPNNDAVVQRTEFHGFPLSFQGFRAQTAQGC